eukprot:c10950_g1_i1.p1 GENE.c10950_g1_i1~~c10950_g1_i1.p1  ORF type:complete len:425 (-),score=121.90 c10950_g1_i1:182-1456(-)
MPTVCSHPSSAPHHCSCSHFSRLGKHIPNTKQCATTTSAFVLAAFWLLDASVCFVLGCHQLQSLYISHHNHALKMDILNVSCVFSLLTAFVFTVTRVLTAINLIDTSAPHTSLQLLLEAISALLMLLKSLVLGVSVLLLLLQTRNLRPINAKHMQRWVIGMATTLGSVNITGTLIFSTSDIGALSLFLSCFAIVTWVVFVLIVRYMDFLNIRRTTPCVTDHMTFGSNDPITDAIPKALPNQMPFSTLDELPASAASPEFELGSSLSQVKSVSPVAGGEREGDGSGRGDKFELYVLHDNNSNQNNNHSNNSSNDNLNMDTNTQFVARSNESQASSQTLICINDLSIRTRFLALSFAVFTFAFGVLWYVGKRKCSENILGNVLAAIYAVVYVILTLLVLSAAVFMRQIAHIRINQAKSASRTNSQM